MFQRNLLKLATLAGTFEASTRAKWLMVGTAALALFMSVGPAVADPPAGCTDNGYCDTVIIGGNDTTEDSFQFAEGIPDYTGLAVYIDGNNNYCLYDVDGWGGFDATVGEDYRTEIWELDAYDADGNPIDTWSQEVTDYGVDPYVNDLFYYDSNLAPWFDGSTPELGAGWYGSGSDPDNGEAMGVNRTADLYRASDTE